MKKKEQRTKCDALGSSLGLLPMAHQSQTKVDSYPLPTLVTWQPSEPSGRQLLSWEPKALICVPLKHPWEAVSVP